MCTQAKMLTADLDLRIVGTVEQRIFHQDLAVLPPVVDIFPCVS